MEIHLFLVLCLGFLFQQKLVLSDNFTAYCRNGEEYQMCGACERTCENPTSTEACTTPCAPGCFCTAGLVRNRQKRCVPPKECNTTTAACGENEEYLDCGSPCPLTCSNYQESLFCTKQCTKGCFCLPGYVLDANKKCILPQNCPIGPCGENEVTTDCANPCNNCAQRKKCTFEFCSRGCDCKHGFHRNSTGNCVEAKDCDVPESACPKHEHFVSCVSVCNDCWSRGDCETTFCQPGCDCNPGFFRDENGECIPESQCITDDISSDSCGLNEEYTDCVCPCNDCTKKGQCEYTCEYGCDCKKGYFRNSTGVCIHEAQCEESGIDPRNCRSCRNKCPVNQQYYICMPTCKNTCDNFNDSSLPCGSECRSGCYCKPGLVMGSNGVCIPPSECPEKCGMNEEYSTCGPSCPESCENFGKSIMCTHRCAKGCFCKKGFVRGPQGTCIQPQLCPAECGENEEYLHCGPACPLTCENQIRTTVCTHDCVRGCFCKIGFIRGPDGKCINPAFCPVVCGPNEEFLKCGTACPVSCANRTLSQTLPCPDKCVPGCFCTSGFIRGPDGSCVSPAVCPAECRENEEFQECGTPCPMTCHNRTSHKVCPSSCVRGCFCRKGYVIGPRGGCILPTDCPENCKAKEEFMQCGPPCPSTCENIGKLPCAVPCTKGCFCRSGLVRGPGGECIPPALCPVDCGPNQEFFECGPCPLSCANYTLPKPRINVNECHRGCFCKSGFVIGPDGSCIPITNCPPVCEENEVFQECGPGCPITCDNQLEARQCTKRCVRGCFCAPGFIRGPFGKCVPPTECPQVCGENEEFKDCGTACPPTCSKLTRPGYCATTCVRGCFCKANFVRDPSGRCIKPQFCPVECGENEEFKECGTACPPTCTNLTSQRSCSNLCIRGCFCRDGFVRNPSGRCVLPQTCPPACKENEEFQQCGSACPVTCDSISRPTVPCPLPCISGCFCRPGFVKGPDGRCILSTSCPVRCGENEEFNECGTACPLTCTNRTQSRTLCPTICVRGCFCKPGFVRDASGKCVLPEICPIVCTNQNEEFRECGPGCPITCDTLTSANVPCSLPCMRGCFCKPGFVRNPEGRCILPAFCPVVCGENEEFKDCASQCPVTCSNITAQLPCTLPCLKGCYCKEGFVRDPTGKCVLPQFCPVVCKPNEEFKECGTACQPTCETLGVPSGPCPRECQKGCFCKPGLVRDRSGNCVLPSLCPVVCGVNEEFRQCGSACAPNCTTRFQSIACPAVCIRGCFCKDGFFRDSSGKCVQPDLCPVVCRENEMFRECGPSCQLSCDNLSKTLGMCILQCVKGCFCKPGYVRNSEGKCILPALCPIACGENEEFKDCGTVCPATCNNPNQPQNCPRTCVKGCFCRAGYVRDPAGKCVLPQFCPVVCKENEVFQECGTACPHTCDDLGKPTAPCMLPCRRGCFCKSGHVRNKEGKCILPHFCPVVCGDHEEFNECGSACPANCTHSQPKCPTSCVKGCFCCKGFVRNSEGKCIPLGLCPVVCKENEQFLQCGSACPLTCDNIGTPSLPCPLSCTKGCFCKPGYVRDRTGRCILPNFCPIVCGMNEEFQECGTACPTNCTNRLQPWRLCPAVCVKGCFCRSGFIRDSSGKCVLPTECPVVCRPNEEFKECGLPCQITCDNLGMSVAPCPLQCTRGCFCKPGFVRNRDGNCVRPSLCPVVCGQNEEFKTCGTACPATCTSGADQRQCPAVCVKGCFCKPGFVRDPTGKCVPPDSCPVVCRENEEFKECGTACPANCTNPSPRGLCPAVCVRGCFCRSGFVRDSTGKCVPPDQCPIICRGENEEFEECGTACPANCTSPSPPRLCPAVCVRGCFCKPGFVRDPTGICIPKDQCPLDCGENEIFKKCGSACPTNCTNLVPKSPCPLPCVRGCFCRQGFVRGPNGKCIKPDTCPMPCGPLEVFKECGPACPANCTHPNPDKPGLKTTAGNCVRGCFCKEGLLRNSEGKCVPPEQCPPVCGENEQLEECGTACPATCADRNPNRLCSSVCVKGCFCRPGFVRHPTGKCVRPDRCPIICQENEIFQKCGSACPITCSNFTNPAPCSLSCISGCFCKSGFIKGPNGKCINPNMCPEECPRPNEVFLQCGPKCIQTCSRVDPRRKCDSNCVKGCFCREGFVRDIAGNCIRPSECPSEPQRCPPEETFYACVPPCGNTCDTLHPAIVRSCQEVCRPGCFCPRGLVKTREGRCVRRELCPSTIEYRNLGIDDEDTNATSVNTLQTTQPTTTEITTLQTELSTSPAIVTTRRTTVPKLPESRALSTVPSTTPTSLPTTNLPTTLPSTSIRTTKQQQPRVAVPRVFIFTDPPEMTEVTKISSTPSGT